MIKNNRNGKKLWVEVPVELYDGLYKNSKKRNITFTKYINRALLRYLIKEELNEDDKKLM